MDGVEVVGAASNGEQAVKLVADGNTDVVLMDLRMPVLDGVGAALRATAAGQSTFDPEVSRRLVAALAADKTPTRSSDGLTSRETEVLRLIARGLSNTEIATTLFISEATVKTHINNTFAKIGARHRAEAVRYAYRNGLAEG
jgi:DNA-binding NarL/FixJ family response regulator